MHTMYHNNSLRSYAGTSILFCGLVLVMSSGCTLPSLFEKPKPPPPAVWTPAVGFTKDTGTKVAVLIDDQSRRNRAATGEVEDVFVEGLLSKGYKVAARSDMKKVLQELQFQQSGMTEEGAAKLGKMLNASSVLIVKINSISISAHDTGMIYNGRRQIEHIAKCSMSARLISVEKVEIIGSSSYSWESIISNADDPSPVVVLAAKRIADSIP